MEYATFVSFLSFFISLENSVAKIVLDKCNVTETYVDDECIITGTDTGLLTVRNLQTGQKLYDLNVAHPNQKSDNKAFIDANASERVNCIQRHGKWIFSCQEVDNKIMLFFNVF